jgi:hypothetical protein
MLKLLNLERFLIDWMTSSNRKALEGLPAVRVNGSVTFGRLGGPEWRFLLGGFWAAFSDRKGSSDRSEISPQPKAWAHRCRLDRFDPNDSDVLESAATVGEDSCRLSSKMSSLANRGQRAEAKMTVGSAALDAGWPSSFDFS